MKTTSLELCHYKKKEKLGEGAYGKVYKGVTKTGELVAIKEMKSRVQNNELSIVGTT